MCRLGTVKKNVKVSASKPLTLFRWFKVITGKQFITPVYMFDSKVWEQKIAKSDYMPRVYNNSGLYGYTSVKEATDDKPGVDYILAKIQVWGETVVHEFGRRAQFAKIVGFYPQINSDTYRENLREASQVSKLTTLAKSSTHFSHIPVRATKPVEIKKKSSGGVLKKKVAKKKVAKKAKKKFKAT